MSENILVNKKIIIKLLFIVCLFVSANFLIYDIAKAATSDTSIVIQPSKIEAIASPGQNISESFSIINRSNFNVKLKLVVKDYKQVSEDGQLQFYDAKTEPASSWLVPQYLQVGLKPLETKDIGFVISVPKEFSGGGHYGSIMFQAVGDENNIVTANFGELVMLTVSGSGIKTTEIGKVANFWTNGIQQGNPVDFNLRMQNIGNTHFETRGQLILKDWFGRDVGNFNIRQLTVYPNTSRLFKWRWNDTPLFGMFKANVMLFDGTSGQNLKNVASSWFIIFPLKMSAIILLTILAVFVIITYTRKVFMVMELVKNMHKNETKIRLRNLSKNKNSIIPKPVDDASLK